MDDVDDYYVWQCRIHHGIRNQKVALPFPESVRIGLEFNAAREREEKLDQCLLTNAVMLEICDFAKTVTRSEKYFLFEMLEFNFDLGVDMDDDMLWYEYLTRVHHKIKLQKEQLRMKPHRWTEAFSLPDTNTIKEFTMSEVPGRYYAKRNRITDVSVLTDGSRTRQRLENQKSQSNVFKRKGRYRPKPTADLYPFCRKLGVSLTCQHKQKLDLNLLTMGVMFELLDFSRTLCGTLIRIVNDLVKHNFGQELDRFKFHMQLSKLIEKRYACSTAEDRDAFRKEVFAIQSKKPGHRYRKRKNADSDFQNLEKLTVVSKRRRTLRHRDSEAQEDLSYMCPVNFDTEMQSGAEVGLENNEFESVSGSAVSLDVKQEEEEALVSAVQPQDDIYFHPNVRTLKTDFDLFSEEKHHEITVKTQKQKVWTRRSARSRQILKPRRVKDFFPRSREIGLDFNVASGNKQKLEPQLLTNWVLWEVFKFATAMTKSLRSFLLDILSNNFNLSLQDDLHLRNMTFYIMAKGKTLQSHPARHSVEFLSSPFQFPEVYNMVNVTSDFRETNSRLSGSATQRQADVELYPFCTKLGLNLWSTQERPPSQKLEVTALTTGAVLEILRFIRELCGSALEMVFDVLQHNFDLDLSDETEAAQVIQRWPVTQRSLMKNQNMTMKISRWLNTVVQLNGHSQLRPQTTRNGLKHLDDLNLKGHRKITRFHMCEEIGLDLDVRSRSKAKAKLDLQVLTRAVLFEVHRYVEQHCSRYVPALYEILEYNFDLSSQSHRKVEFAWSIAAQVISMVAKSGRKGGYLNTVFQLPMEAGEVSQVDCKDEPEDVSAEPDLNDDDVLFVRKLKPVDIEVEIE